MALFAKLWTDVLGDPKLMRAARKGAKQLVLLPWLIVFAKQADDEGRLSVNGEPAEPIDIAQQIPGASEKQVMMCLAELASIGVLDLERDGCYRFGSWEKRAGAKPSDAPSAIGERVARHRKKKRDVTRAGNALQGVTGNATEIEQEIEQDQEKDEEEESPPIDDPISELLAEHDFGPFASAVAGMCRSARNGAAVVQTLRMHIAGEMGYEKATPLVIGLAALQYNANGAEFNSAFFSGFIRRAKVAVNRLDVRARNDVEQKYIASEAAMRDESAREEREADEILAGFKLSHPERYAELEGLADRDVPTTLAAGRASIVRAQLLTRIRREPRAA